MRPATASNTGAGLRVHRYIIPFGKTLAITGFSLTVAFSRNYHLESIASELAFHLNLVEKDMPTGAVVPI